MPGGPFDSSVIQGFCHFVHFFAARQTGEQWMAEHPGTFLLTLAEAADLAARVNQRLFPDCWATAPDPPHRPAEARG